MEVGNYHLKFPLVSKVSLIQWYKLILDFYNSIINFH